MYEILQLWQLLLPVRESITSIPSILLLNMLSTQVHRVWISLEFKKLDYQYVEVDVYRKPKLLLDINPRGLVPALRHGDWGSYESTVLMEYLEDLKQGPALLPEDPKLRAHSRLVSFVSINVREQR